uniref:Cysteine protease n=1 Tax=Chromera velia CCMP2878 TaxID=1169474 RepID=A0A0G4FJM1_9ALVE|eukprot:Cvel_17320.t1-p1 / transcript=Cvel_17320.t1 / gene=Cvel_17320 / organism=Chromera_velia_CCMP2878 / gene_product=Cysteine protease ATG4B, putative / transcript_product=Cysteine protease ATG4B, putative / location=Cvel_scaffold1375:29027-33883(-) / protein_length=886 / sequence_SO=supercontig / SO=protein_coding / is_pseudo=false
MPRGSQKLRPSATSGSGLASPDADPSPSPLPAGRSTSSFSFGNAMSAVKNALINMIPFPWRANPPKVVMLAREYDLSQNDSKDKFMLDFNSKILFTYRNRFVPILPHGTASLSNGTVASGSSSWSRTSGAIVTDAGWGCMIRVTQMALVQTMISHLLGRDWRFDELRDWSDKASVFIQIIERFRDVPDAPFSLHNFVMEGHGLGKQAADWFGPTSGAVAMRRVIELQRDHSFGLRAVVFEDGAIYKDVVYDAFGVTPPEDSPTSLQEVEGGAAGEGGHIRGEGADGDGSISVPLDSSLCCNGGDLVGGGEGKSSASGGKFEEENEKEREDLSSSSFGAKTEKGPPCTGLMLMVCVRLGNDRFNQELYQAQIQSCFSVPQFQGLSGGGPTTSAYFFVAANNENVYYLDPHVKVQPAFTSVGSSVSSSGPPRGVSGRDGGMERERERSHQGVPSSVERERGRPLSAASSVHSGGWKDVSVSVQGGETTAVPSASTSPPPHDPGTLPPHSARERGPPEVKGEMPSSHHRDGREPAGASWAGQWRGGDRWNVVDRSQSGSAQFCHAPSDITESPHTGTAAADRERIDSPPNLNFRSAIEGEVMSDDDALPLSLPPAQAVSLAVPLHLPAAANTQEDPEPRDRETSPLSPPSPSPSPTPPANCSKDLQARQPDSMEIEGDGGGMNCTDAAPENGRSSAEAAGTATARPGASACVTFSSSSSSSPIPSAEREGQKDHTAGAPSSSDSSTNAPTGQTSSCIATTNFPYSNPNLNPSPPPSSGQSNSSSSSSSASSPLEPEKSSQLRPGEPRQLQWSALNPSMCANFLCRDTGEFEDLLERLRALDPHQDVFEVFPRRPKYTYRADMMRAVHLDEDGDEMEAEGEGEGDEFVMI